MQVGINMGLHPNISWHAAASNLEHSPSSFFGVRGHEVQVPILFFLVRDFSVTVEGGIPQDHFESLVLTFHEFHPIACELW